MSILVTGAAGFLGRYLIDHLETNESRTATAAVRSKKKIWSYRSPRVEIDLTRADAVAKLIEQVKPTEIYHLAGHSRVTNSLRLPDYFASNYLTTMSLMRALRNCPAPVRLFLASTIHVYGNYEQVADESSAPQPVNDYGFTKYISEELLRGAVRENENLSVVVGRLYSCFGPGQAPGFVSADLCQKISCLPDNQIGTLRVGPLSTYRRFLDVRDAVAVFPKLLRASFANRFQIVNIASPHEVQIKDLVTALLKISNKKAHIESTEDNSDNRLFGIKVDCSLMMKLLPQTRFRPLGETLREMYSEQVRKLNALSC